MTAMTPAWVNPLGFAAGLLTTVSLIPQVTRIIKLRTARDVSVEMYLLFTIGVMMWLAYGIILHAWPIIVWNGVSLFLSAAILILKLRFDRNAAHELMHPLSKEGEL